MKTKMEYIGVCYTCRDMSPDVFCLTAFDFMANSYCDKCHTLSCGLALAMTFVGEASIEELHAASGLETF